MNDLKSYVQGNELKFNLKLYLDIVCFSSALAENPFSNTKHF